MLDQRPSATNKRHHWRRGTVMIFLLLEPFAPEVGPSRTQSSEAQADLPQEPLGKNSGYNTSPYTPNPKPQTPNPKPKNQTHKPKTPTPKAALMSTRQRHARAFGRDAFPPTLDKPRHPRTGLQRDFVNIPCKVYSKMRFVFSGSVSVRNRKL